MPIGPNGEVRPRDPVQSAWTVVQLATGQITEEELRERHEAEEDKEEAEGQPLDECPLYVQPDES